MHVGKCTNLLIVALYIYICVSNNSVSMFSVTVFKTALIHLRLGFLNFCCQWKHLEAKHLLEVLSVIKLIPGEY